MIDLTVLDDVLLLFVEEIPGFERGVQLVRKLDVALIVEVADPEHLLDFGDAGFRDRSGVRFLIDGEVFVFLQARDDLREFCVELGRVVTLPADDERRARFIDRESSRLRRRSQS